MFSLLIPQRREPRLANCVMYMLESNNLQLKTYVKRIRLGKTVAPWRSKNNTEIKTQVFSYIQIK